MTGDGGQMPQNRCSNCLAYNLDCTYVEAAKVCLDALVHDRSSLMTLWYRNADRRRGELILDVCMLCDVISSCRYVESLENRLENMEKLLQRVRTV